MVWEIVKPLPFLTALTLIAIAVPVVSVVELVIMGLAAVVDISSIWKPTPAVVRIPFRLNRTIPLVGAAVEVVVTKRAFPAPVSAVPVVIDSPVPVVRAVALIDIAVPPAVEAVVSARPVPDIVVEDMAIPPVPALMVVVAAPVVLPIVTASALVVPILMLPFVVVPVPASSFRLPPVRVVLSAPLASPAVILISPPWLTTPARDPVAFPAVIDMLPA